MKEWWVQGCFEGFLAGLASLRGDVAKVRVLIDFEGDRIFSGL